MATETSKPESPIREGDLLFLEGGVVEVATAEVGEDGRLLVENEQGKVFMVTIDEARASLISRDEDMYSTTILDLRFKEAMLMGQLELVGALWDPRLMQDSAEQAKLELHRVLYAVRFMLEKRGARRADE